MNPIRILQVQVVRTVTGLMTIVVIIMDRILQVLVNVTIVKKDVRMKMNHDLVNPVVVVVLKNLI